MNVSDLSQGELVRRAASSDGFCLDVGPFVVRLRSRERQFLDTIQLLYHDFPVASSDAFADFHVDITSPGTYRRWLKRQVVFSIDGTVLFQPFPATHAMPLFEWGLNWCIGRRAQQHLMLHAAVVEKFGMAMILPAFPGSGKSTLCAALAQSGWRFFSDEFGLIRPRDGHIIPIPRPTPLKNVSIQVIHDFAPQAVFGPLFPKTRKGTVAHLRAPGDSVRRMRETATPARIIFPRYQPEATVELKKLNKPYALLKLATNAFNYEVMGTIGFELVRDMVRSCDCYDLTYGNLTEVIARLDDLAADSCAF